MTIQEKWEYTDKTGYSFLNFTVHIRHYCNSSYVNWQIQFSITFSKFQKYWHCFYSFFKCFFSFYFHQATFPFHKMFYYPNFHDISPFSTSIPILKNFLYFPAYTHFWGSPIPLNKGRGLCSWREFNYLKVGEPIGQDSLIKKSPGITNWL